MDRDELYKKLGKWKAALRMNQTLQANYRDEVTKHRTTRDELKEEIKEFREKAFNEKDIRDKINAEVAKLKEDRSAANTQIAELKQKRNDAWEQVKQIRNQLRALIQSQRDAKQQLKSIYPMIKQLEALDWTIMTKSMPFEQEQALMEEIDRIVDEIAAQKSTIEYDAVSLDFDEAKKQIDEFKEVAQRYHELMIQTVSDGENIHARILDLVKESEKHHEAMQDLFNQIEPLQKEEEAAHQMMVENIKELKKAFQDKFTQNPLAFFRTYIMPLLPKETKLSGKIEGGDTHLHIDLRTHAPKTNKNQGLMPDAKGRLRIGEDASKV